MKKFTKLFLSCAAVTAITAAVATSAMAADVTGDVVGTYDAGKLSLTSTYEGTSTILVLAPGTDATAVSADDVLYIDQVADGAFGEMGLKGAPTEETAPGTYTVLVGSYVGEEFVVKTGSFRLGSAGVLVGDVDMNEDIDLDDATTIVKHAVKIAEITDANALIAADVDENDDIDLDDATCIVKYSVKMTTGTGAAGQTK